MAVFGAYVALSVWLPKYYVDNFGVDLWTAALLTATFIFPASLLRPLGGWFSDKFGARRGMYFTFTVMLVTSGLLMMPNGHLVVVQADGAQTEHWNYSLGIVPFVILVFLLGCAMGIGKAAVYKHIPEYFPRAVGPVGGLVGMLGGLGGFFLPPMFAYTKDWFGFPSSYLLRHLRAHRGLRPVDALDRRAHAAPGLAPARRLLRAAARPQPGSARSGSRRPHHHRDLAHASATGSTPRLHQRLHQRTPPRKTTEARA